MVALEVSLPGRVFDGLYAYPAVRFDPVAGS